MNSQELFEYSKTARKNILDIITAASSSHIGSSFSTIDILITLYHGILDVEKIQSKASDRDYLILSKGHAASALYTALHSADLIDKETLHTYCQDNSKLTGHPIKGNLPGVEISSGSLGHGLPIAMGIAFVCKQSEVSSRVFVVMSDGELNEGSVWEGVIFSGRKQLSNLTVIVDCNQLQGLDPTDAITNTKKYSDQFSAFDWEVVSINGHDFKEIHEALSPPLKPRERPLVVLANTIKGKGVSFMENEIKWHYKSPNPQEYKLAEKEILDARYVF